MRNNSETKFLVVVFSVMVGIMIILSVLLSVKDDFINVEEATQCEEVFNNSYEDLRCTFAFNSCRCSYNICEDRICELQNKVFTIQE